MTRIYVASSTDPQEPTQKQGIPMSQNPLTRTVLHWAVAATFGLSCCGMAQAQLAVVVSTKSATASMTAEQVSNIFLGKTPAPSADLPESNPVRDQFYTKATGKTAAQVKAVWARLIFSGKATPPKELTSAAEVKKFVAANPDAIGYVEKSAVDSSVKVVLELN
jgi:ABC-type phosphate transport system substrate-binding protein